jgi:rRNA-processing protein FCF1
MAIIVCDTDFLIKVANEPLPKLDWTTISKQNEFCTLPSVVKELKGLSTGNRKSLLSRRARMALGIIGRSSSSIVRIIDERPDRMSSESSKGVDADLDLFDFVKSNPQDRLVATLDGALLSRLERNRLPYLTLSSGRALINSSKRATRLSRGR